MFVAVSSDMGARHPASEAFELTSVSSQASYKVKWRDE